MNYQYNILTGVLLLVLAAGAALADQLPENWSNELKANTRMLMNQVGDATQPVAMTKSMVQARYEEQQILRVQNRIKAGLDDGLPAEPLMLKVSEGVVKRVNADNLLQALERVQNRYLEAHRHAKHLAADKSRKSVSNLIADVQAAGVKGKNLDQIINSLRERHSKTVRVSTRRQLNVGSLELARDLARVGVTPALTADVVSGVLEKGATGTELKEIARELRKNRNRRTANEHAKLCLQAINQEPNVTQVMNRVRVQTRAASSFGSALDGQANGNDSSKGNGGSSSSGSGSSGDSGSGGSGGGSSGGSGGSSSGGSGGSGNSGGNSGSSSGSGAGGGSAGGSTSGNGSGGSKK